jgi:hypothetical protein
MQQLRTAYFSNEEIAGLFGASDAYDLDAIARLDISSDTSLTATQRQQRLAELDARLPQQVREEKDAPTKVMRLEESVSAARTRRRRQRGLPHARRRAVTGRRRAWPMSTAKKPTGSAHQRLPGTTQTTAAKHRQHGQPAATARHRLHARRTKTPACL